MLAIALGGAAGAVLRFAAVQASADLFGRAFPWGTLLVNVAGSLAIGALAAWFHERGENELLRAALVVGLLGGFTTFSAFSLETVHLAMTGQGWRALANVAASVLLCVGAAGAGLKLMKFILT